MLLALGPKRWSQRCGGRRQRCASFLTRGAYRALYRCASRVENPDAASAPRADRTARHRRDEFKNKRAPSCPATATHGTITGQASGGLSRVLRFATNRCFGLVDRRPIIRIEHATRPGSRPDQDSSLVVAPALCRCARSPRRLVTDTRVKRGSFVLSSNARCWNLKEDYITEIGSSNNRYTPDGAVTCELEPPFNSIMCAACCCCRRRAYDVPRYHPYKTPHAHKSTRIIQPRIISKQIEPRHS